MSLVDEQYVDVVRRLSSVLDIAASIPTYVRGTTAGEINTTTSRVVGLLSELRNPHLVSAPRDHELTRSITRARILCARLKRKLDRTFDRTVTRGPQRTDVLSEYAWHIHAAINQAHMRAYVLAYESEAQGERTSDEDFEAVGREKLPLLVLNMAVGVLPITYRDRYLEEFRAELADHSSWRERLAYSIQVALNSLSLRRNLSRMPKPIPASSSGDAE